VVLDGFLAAANEDPDDVALCVPLMEQRVSS
jgi:hypothetical protein